MVIRKITAALFTVLLMAGVSSVVYGYYGIQNLIAEPKPTVETLPNSGASSANNANAQGQNQETVIQSLLNRANAQNAATPNGANNPGQQNNNPSSASVQNPGLSDQAFADTVRNTMPLSPKQIEVLRYLFDESQR